MLPYGATHSKRRTPWFRPKLDQAPTTVPVRFPELCSPYPWQYSGRFLASSLFARLIRRRYQTVQDGCMTRAPRGIPFRHSRCFGHMPGLRL